jgi:hypothetical protein
VRSSDATIWNARCPALLEECDRTLLDSRPVGLQRRQEAQYGCLKAEVAAALDGLYEPLGLGGDDTRTVSLQPCPDTFPAPGFEWNVPLETGRGNLSTRTEGLIFGDEVCLVLVGDNDVQATGCEEAGGASWTAVVVGGGSNPVGSGSVPLIWDVTDHFAFFSDGLASNSSDCGRRSWRRRRDLDHTRFSLFLRPTIFCA